MKKVNLEDSWKDKLIEEFKKDYMQSLSEFLRSEKSKDKIIFPPGKKIFNALNLTSFENVKKKNSIPLHGTRLISFDTIEILSRKKINKININKIKKLNKTLKKNILEDIKSISKKKQYKVLNI